MKEDEDVRYMLLVHVSCRGRVVQFGGVGSRIWAWVQVMDWLRTRLRKRPPPTVHAGGGSIAQLSSPLLLLHARCSAQLLIGEEMNLWRTVESQCPKSFVSHLFVGGYLGNTAVQCISMHPSL